MNKINKALETIMSTDVYKTGHKTLYNNDITKVFSNFTPRSGNWANPDLGFVVADGMRYVIKELKKEWNDNFFSLSISEVYKVVKLYEKEVVRMIGCKTFDASHFIELHKLGKLPLQFRAVEEGAHIPYKQPILTVHNTNDKFAWLVNYLETRISAELWPIVTASTKAYAIKQQLLKWAEKTGTDKAFVDFQAHDFSFRGMEGAHGAKLVGIGHLQHFIGSDNMPAILATGKGMSVIATEHSIMSSSAEVNQMVIEENDPRLNEMTMFALNSYDFRTLQEFYTYKDLIENNPNGILSIVSDTFNIYKVCENILPLLKREINERNGKLVIRPDSGDAIKVLLGGQKLTHPHATKMDKMLAKQGLLSIIEEHFGATVNAKGYKVLPIGFLWGDGMTPAKIEELFSALEKAGYASENVAIGVGSYAYQLNTRDTYGFAMKATYVEIGKEGFNISKDPITDKGVKKSATGLLAIFNGKLVEECSWDDVKSKENQLQEVK